MILYRIIFDIGTLHLRRPLPLHLRAKNIAFASSFRLHLRALIFHGYFILLYFVNAKLNFTCVYLQNKRAQM